MENAINWNPPATLYIYQADLYCKPCGDATIEQLNEALDKDIHGTLDWSNSPDLYEDSDSWPQAYPKWEGESDSPDHCAQCHRFLGRHLTPDGVEYVQDLAAFELDRDGVIGEIVQGWLDYYGIDLDSIDGEEMKNMTGHTPGPWEVTGPNIRQGETRALLFVQEKPFADAEPDPDEQAANAQLIAAAPEMYAALVDLIEQIEAYDRLHGPDSCPISPDAARAAIAKAELD